MILSKEQIIKNPEVIKKYLDNTLFSEVVSVLCINNSDIPNRVYLYKIDGHSILEILLERNYKPFSNKDLKERIRQNIELVDDYFQTGVLFDLSIVPIDKLLETQDDKTNLQLLIANIKNLDFFNTYNEDIQSLGKVFEHPEVRTIVINILMTSITKWNNNTIILLKSLMSKMTNEEIINILTSDKDKVIEYFKNSNTFRNALFKRFDGSLVNLFIDKFIEIFEIIDKHLLLKVNNQKMILDYLLESNKWISCKSLYNRIMQLSDENISFAFAILNHQILNTKVHNFNDESPKNYEDLLIGVLNKAQDKDYYNYYFKPFILSNKLSVDFLLYQVKGMTVLEYLLKFDSSEEVKKLLIKNHLDNNYHITLILRLNNIELNQEIIDFDDYIIADHNPVDKQEYEQYLSYPVDNESQELIKELITLFNDGLSDKSVVDLLVNSFIYRFANNCEYAKRDLETIIQIKKSDKSFRLSEYYLSGQFENYVKINSYRLYSISSIIHELTHAMHHYIKNFETPEIFTKTTFIINQNNYAEFIKLFKYQVSIKYAELKKENYDYFQDNKGRNQIINSYQRLVNNAFDLAENNPSYSKEVIDYLRNHYVVEEEYHKYYNEYYARKLSIISVDEYFRCIIDIVDALSDGNIFDEGIELLGIKEKIGHGSDYYKKKDCIFGEILANYSTIINSHFKKDGLFYLEKIVGRELIQILDDYYKELSFGLDENKKTI